MPHCETSENVSIYYETFGQGDTKVLLIMGFAATLEAWNHQIRELAIPSQDYEEDEPSSVKDNANMSLSGIQICAFDSRGVGKSSAPESKSKYTTEIMAMDAIALMDHLKWEKAHVFGHSLGAMVSSKLAAISPDRVASLALLSATGGGYQSVPKLNMKLLSIAYRFWKAKSPEQRALVDLDTHYTEDYLDDLVGEESRREYLFKEYVKNISTSGVQPSHGEKGQLNACWTHKMTSQEYERIRKSSILVSVIHGRGDVIASVKHARTITRHLHPVARMVELPGGHLITHQHTEEVNQELKELIKAANSNLHTSEWIKGCTLHGVKTGHRSNVNTEDTEGCCGFLKALYRQSFSSGDVLKMRPMNKET